MRGTIGLAAAACALVCLALPVRAQDAPPAMSPFCAAPAGEIASPAPLPHVSRLLEKRKPIRVLAVGSSASRTRPGSEQKSYPAEFETIVEKALKGVDVEVVSRGISGEIASAVAERLRNEVARLKPDLVLWQVGANDALARIPAEDVAAVVRETVAWLKEHDIDVVLVGLQYTPRLADDPQFTEIRKAIQQVASAENVLLVRRYDALRFINRTMDNLEQLSSDEFHLAGLGAQCLAEHVADAVVTSLFLKRQPPAKR